MSTEAQIAGTAHIAKPLLQALAAAGVEVGKPYVAGWMGSPTNPATVYPLPVRHERADRDFDSALVGKPHTLTVHESGRFQTSVPTPDLRDGVGMTRDPVAVRKAVNAVAARLDLALA